MADRSFSHAIAEGDGISVIAAVEDAEAARSAESQRAEALVVRSDPSAFRDATALPILWRAEIPFEQATASADAVMLVFDSLDGTTGGSRSCVSARSRWGSIARSRCVTKRSSN